MLHNAKKHNQNGDICVIQYDGTDKKLDINSVIIFIKHVSHQSDHSALTANPVVGIATVLIK